MKQLCLVFFVLAVSANMGHSIPSGTAGWAGSPIRLPFVISINVTGDMLTVTSDRLNPDSTHHKATIRFEFDPAGAGYVPVSYHGDTLDFSYSAGDQYGFDPIRYDNNVRIIFDTIAKRVKSLSAGSSGVNKYGGISQSVALYDLRYDSSGIYYSEPVLTNHKGEAHYHEQEFLGNDYYLDSLTSFTLGGVFLPEPTSSVASAPTLATFAIRQSNGRPTCEFAPSDHTRAMEIYSDLGVRVADLPILADQTVSALPHLRAGFYFLRLDGLVRKLYIAE